MERCSLIEQVKEVFFMKKDGERQLVGNSTQGLVACHQLPGPAHLTKTNHF